MASLACLTGSQISFSCPTDGAPFRGMHRLMLKLSTVRYSHLYNLITLSVLYLIRIINNICDQAQFDAERQYDPV